MFVRVSVWSRIWAAIVIMLWSAAGAGLSATESGPAEPTDQTGAVLYRIFLRDGSTIVSYGEFARVADRIIASIPIGGTDSNPVLHVLTIAERDIDWDRTNAYVQAVRAKHYADTRGDFDFALLTREVADILYQVGSTDDAARRVALAEDARRRLVGWAPQHYNYRSEELVQMTTWLDQVVSELRVAAGQSSFDLAFISPPVAAAVPSVELKPPTFRERVELGLTAARRAADPTERVSLLRAVVEALPADDAANAEWLPPLRTAAAAELAAEIKTDEAYASVTTQALSRAAMYHEKANVRGVESVVLWVLAEDRRLNQARPGSLAALLTTLDMRIEAARRLRLAQDQWVLRAAVLREYWRDVRQGLDRLLGIREWLIDVRQLAGPAPGSLRRLGELAAYAQRELSAVTAPPEVKGAHSALTGAAAMAVRAASTRTDAVRSARMEVAWEASSAAAGALLLLDNAVEELRRITRAPQPCQKCQNVRAGAE